MCQLGASHLPSYDEETDYEVDYVDDQIEEEEAQLPRIISKDLDYFTKENNNVSLPCAVENQGTFFRFS